MFTHGPATKTGTESWGEACPPGDFATSEGSVSQVAVQGYHGFATIDEQYVSVAHYIGDSEDVRDEFIDGSTELPTERSTGTVLPLLPLRRTLLPVWKILLSQSQRSPLGES